MKYGDLPKSLGIHEVECDEMMFYQDMLVKEPLATSPIYESRLSTFDSIVGHACCDFIGEFGLDRFVNSYVYISAKRLFQSPGCGVSRPGWHSDGFMTDDINYIWSDCNSTIFNQTLFDLSEDDVKSLQEMEDQAEPMLDWSFPDKSLLRLNQFNIHKAADVVRSGMRTFMKLSFSYSKYDLKGNSHNYLLGYNWEMRERNINRNIPGR